MRRKSIIRMKLNYLISQRLGLSEKSVNNTISLLEDGATIPFIARYRKEATNSLDETAIAAIDKEFTALNELIKRKEYILQIIEEQGKLSTSLRDKITSCWDKTKLEDYYLPFKKKRKTKAEKARLAGLQPLADIILEQHENNLFNIAKKYLSKEYASVEEALAGARDIIAEYINENGHYRDLIRRLFELEAQIVTKLIKSKESEAYKYKDYFDFSEKASKSPSHRILAIFRAEKEKLIRCSLSVDESKAGYKIGKLLIRSNSSKACAQQLTLSIEDALKRLLLPSMENEFRSLYKEKADKEAINVFTENLKQLLLAAPLGACRVMGIDPGFRTGCKLVCLDENSRLLGNTTIYPHPPQNAWTEAQDTIKSLVEKYEIKAIAIGNGTAGRESLALAKSIDFHESVDCYLINEDGASIYSASEIAREEFPDLDLTVRGTISIARRLIDPLSELVKIDPKSIGVGQYQHDVNPTLLKDSLDRCIEYCVNAVGVDLNTASEYLLQHISGLGPVLAKNIVSYRKENGAFKSMQELKKVPRMGAKAFELSAGFLRIRGGKNILDNTGVHPERYALVKQMAKDKGIGLDKLISDKTLLDSINLQDYIGNDIGLPTLKDIISELKKPGFDIRGKAETFEFTKGINAIEDIQPGMYVRGIINNITKFGAFVDIGIKESALIHISQMSNTFIKDPLDVVKLNQKIQAKVIDVDVQRKRISLSLKD